ncbi:hypothetical protein BDN70DRAFT_931153 [Pholiota conissans]|uniref:Uncharacterized protein n=1 Tax=Pholiota conissans TaxID=109636 RepID=A0A9P5Z6K5_9AGAR|nr:hypothetical protein BDN70DRAFT_931153 [Pholiota conissans]
MAPNNDDALYLRNISQGLLEEFCNTIFNTLYITSNPAKFLNTDWVNVKDLKAFVASLSRPPADKNSKPAFQHHVHDFLFM